MNKQPKKRQTQRNKCIDNPYSFAKIVIPGTAKMHKPKNSKQASKQASKPTSKQTSKQAAEPSQAKLSQAKPGEVKTSQYKPS